MRAAWHLESAAALLEMSVPEVENRATITGSIESGRQPGVVQVAFRNGSGILCASLEL